MNNFKIQHLLIIFLTCNIFFGCSKIRQSAGVTRKAPDEFQVIENPPLVIPPNYSLIPPDQLQEKNIGNIEKELAKEILFGLEEENTTTDNQLTTMSMILSKSNADNISNTIRDDIDEDFAQEISAKDKLRLVWENEIDVLDAVKESERIREKNFNNESVIDGDSPIKKQKMKKKKKRFFFF